jgi:hypothetical protein
VALLASGGCALYDLDVDGDEADAPYGTVDDDESDTQQPGAQADELPQGCGATDGDEAAALPVAEPGGDEAPLGAADLASRAVGPLPERDPLRSQGAAARADPSPDPWH